MPPPEQLHQGAEIIYRHGTEPLVLSVILGALVVALIGWLIK